jgi:hypothetical protein
MLYFILWTIAILFVVLSIPVAHFVEVSRRKKQLAEATTAEPAETDEPEVAEEEEWTGDATEGEQEPAAVGVEAEANEMEGLDAEAAGDDDFSAFDETFDEEKS